MAAAAPPISAQPPAACRAPTPFPVPRPVPIPRGEAVPRSSDGGYVLALSWSPQYCATTRDPLNAQNRDQCAATARKPGSGAGRSGYGWVMHGLWPQAAKGTHPRWCRVAKIVPKPVLQQNFCITPSAQLMQYQWAKHGTCMSANPVSYFHAAARLYRQLKFPDMATLAQKPQNSATIRRAFARANGHRDAGFFAVSTDRQGWLREVRLCLDQRMQPKLCSAAQQGYLGARPILIRR